MAKAKASYAETLQRLEAISDQIHDKSKKNVYLGGLTDAKKSSLLPNLSKLFKKSEVDSIPSTQPTQVPWFHSNEDASATESETDKFEYFSDGFDCSDEEIALQHFINLDHELDFEFKEIKQKKENC